jgi:cobyrinic acid a,c-diamide synthase
MKLLKGLTSFQNNLNNEGVVINKVIPEKYEQTKEYIQKAMLQTWGIPLLGCIPGATWSFEMFVCLFIFR